MGAQTNLSFSVENSLKIYEEAGGARKKLKIWATFHPEMTSVALFSEKCRQMYRAGVSMSVGAVGVTVNRQVIKQLRRALPDEIYLWINQMDGLGRAYTEEEIEDFREVDPYFCRELECVPSSYGLCADRLFVEGDGRLRRCNISKVLPENWYRVWESVFDRNCEDNAKAVPCGKRRCSCYLAYGGRDEAMNQVLFGPYPLFRIPRRPKAVFLDIDGTLIPKGESRIPRRIIADIRALAAEGCKLFFATALPYQDAGRKCGEIKELFQGGIFAGGAHILLDSGQDRREHFFFLEDRLVDMLKQQKEKRHFRILVYVDVYAGGVYKITLVRPRKQGWKEEEVSALKELCAVVADVEGGAVAEGGRVRLFVEENCLQIVAAEATKAEGVKQICSWLGISPRETAAAGDSEEDEAMMAL